MSAFIEALQAFYSGEVLGEAAYSAMHASAQNADERFKWATLLQLETETKAWLRAPMLAHGVSIEEKVSDRQTGLGAVDGFRQLSWTGQLQALQQAILSDFVPAYQRFADAARARGKPDEEAICVCVVEHEKAQAEFARRELAGAKMEESLEPVARLLKYPLKR